MRETDLSHLRGIVDQLFGGAWLQIDDHVISQWFDSDRKRALAAAETVAEENGWAFRHDRQFFYFGRAYAKRGRTQPLKDL